MANDNDDKKKSKKGQRPQVVDDKPATRPRIIPQDEVMPPPISSETTLDPNLQPTYRPVANAPVAPTVDSNRIAPGARQAAMPPAVQTDGTLPPPPPAMAVPEPDQHAGPPTVSPYDEQVAAQMDVLNKPMPEESEDSRFMSGLKQLLAFEPFQMQYGLVRNWDEFLARLGGSAGQFAGAMANPVYGEQKKWHEERTRAQEELDRLRGNEKDRLDREYRQTQIQNIKDDNVRLEQERQDRQARFEEQQLGRNRTQLLNQVFKTGYYKKGENAELDKALEDAGIVQIDFDNRKPQTFLDNGQLKYRDPLTGEYKPAEGVDLQKVKVPMRVRLSNGIEVDLTPETLAQITIRNDEFNARTLNQYNEAQRGRQDQWARLDYQSKMRLVEGAVKRLEEETGRPATREEYAKIYSTVFGSQQR